MSRDVTRTDYHRRGKIRSPRKDQRVFSRTADRTHRVNADTNPRRGGERL